MTSIWIPTQPAADRPHITLRLHRAPAKRKARLLKSPGAEVAENMTFAGQWVDRDGTIRGPGVMRAAMSGAVILVKAGEAVLVSV